MAKGHRSQVKREENAQGHKTKRNTLSYARVSVQKACFVLDAIRADLNRTWYCNLQSQIRFQLNQKLLESAAMLRTITEWTRQNLC